MFNPIKRLLYKLNPEKAIDLKRNDPLKHQKFYNISRETRIMAAREIVEQIYKKESMEGKLTEQDVETYALGQASHSVSHNEYVCQDVTKIVMKLYHLGLQTPDHQL